MGHTYDEKYLAIKKNEILPLATPWGYLEDIMLSEISQTDRIPYDFTYMWNLKSKINEQNRSTLVDSEIRLAVARGKGVVGLGEKGEVLRSIDWWSQNSHGDVT